MNTDRTKPQPSNTRALSCLSWFVTTCLTGLSTLFAQSWADEPSITQTGVVPEPPITDADRDHWSFEPLAQSHVPTVKNEGWCRSEIDQFLLARLEEEELTPLPPADRETLLRRVTFDLTGLPPSLEERANFLHDTSPDAYEKVVDRLLASQAYAERQAQHWLDLARFAETDGFEHDHVRTNAWKYRDWVIDAFANDMPYAEFVRQQLAGDLIPDGSREALGFLIAGPDMPDINLQEERRHFVLNDATATVGAVFLGLQVECASCHHHKYDPLSQHDFYRLRAYFDPLLEFKKNKRTELVADNKTDVESRLMIRGDFRRPGPELGPGVPRIALLPVSKQIEVSSRLDLANWISSSENPLAARVIVNRLWQQHFQRGISRSPNDFGVMGDWPTHPELLDFLARKFLVMNGSFKQFHRPIVTSSAYRTAGRPTPDTRETWNQLVAADRDNELLARFPRRRLSAEEIRDAMLFASGQLNRKAGGEGFRPPLPREVLETLLKNQWPVTEDVSEHTRRSIYLFVRRNLRFPLFDVFDQPDTNQSCARRNESTIAPQALTLLNSELSLDCARTIAKHVRESIDDETKHLTECYLRCLSRTPTENELELATGFLTEFASLETNAKKIDSLTAFCLALLNSSEFLYVD
ncbi:MAG TPA: DUF1549 and DUF1553 domain-containing protein [Planctomycetaceae bacterium]|nr:DUF1549 and DUF1553 domain-containing protein [Planctomycetaceae bacterium]